MYHRIDVTYMGYSLDMLKYLVNDSRYRIVNSIGVINRISDEQYSFLEEHKIPYKELKDKKEIDEIEPFIEKSQVILIYKFEFIIPTKLVKKYLFINFHGGCLKTNRGAHAVVWSILNRDKWTCMTMYKLIGGIDIGLVLGEYYVEIANEENTYTLNRKLAKGIPMLLHNLFDYMNGNLEGKLISTGTYLRKITEADYTIDIFNDDFETIKAKIRSQVMYAGAILVFEGKRYRVKSYAEEQGIYLEDLHYKMNVEANKLIVQNKNNLLVLSVVSEE